jgi:ankyrin repeat protein
VNQQDSYGAISLMHACSDEGSQAFDIVHYLLDYGADRNVRTLSGQTVLDCAQTQEMKDFLLSYQPKV